MVFVAVAASTIFIKQLILVFFSSKAHPTLNRWSTPDVIANFKRRVPPRVPKPRKRDDPPLPSVQPPTLPSHHTLPSSSSLHNGHAHTQYADTLKMPSLGGLSIPHTVGGGRARGFSAPNLTSSGYINGSSNGGSAYFPSPSNGNGGRYTNPSPYPRVPLPPLSMPSHHQGPHHSQQPHHSQHPSHPLTPTDDLNSPSLYNPRSADPYNTAGFSYQQDQPLPQIGQNQWSYLSPGPPSSLSSILNPQSQHNSSSNSYTRPTISALTLSTNFPSYSANGGHGTSSHSPQYAGGSPTDSSRPTTGYSAISHSSVSSSSFDTQLSPIHFSSSGGRPLTPTTSSSNNSSSLAIRRKTSISNHHNSHSPYPSPSDSRPNTSYHSQTQPFAYDSSWNDGRPSSAVAVSRTPNEHPQSQAAQHCAYHLFLSLLFLSVRLTSLINSAVSPDFSFLHMSDAMSGVQRDDHSNGVAYSHEGSMERSASGGSNASDGSAYIGGE
jgi:hypothetical protein